MTKLISRPRFEPTLYSVLRQPPGATVEQLHDAYLKLAFELRHVVESASTVTGPDAERFRQVTAAWGVLKDSTLRRQYDAKLRLRANDCVSCSGTGLRWTFARKREDLCEACNGTGQKV